LLQSADSRKTLAPSNQILFPKLSEFIVDALPALLSLRPQITDIVASLPHQAPIRGEPGDFLVVHVKAGCRSALIYKRSEQGEKDACPVVAEQLVALENYIDEGFGKSFVVLVDFNRSLLPELETYLAR
jgi:hypothetical protein